GVKPSLVIRSVKNDWHPVMNVAGERVRFRRDDRARLNPLPVCAGLPPTFPQARECKWFSAIDFIEVRELRLPLFLPLKISVGQDEAATFLERRPEREAI